LGWADGREAVGAVEGRVDGSEAVGGVAVGADDDASAFVAAESTTDRGGLR
jgi:hypothetical protein